MQLTNVDSSRSRNTEDRLQESRRIRTQNPNSLVAMLLDPVRKSACPIRNLNVRPAKYLAIPGDMVNSRCLQPLAPVRNQKNRTR